MQLMSDSTYHFDLQSFDVKLPNLPVAEKITKDFDEPIDPEDGGHKEEEDNPAVLFNAGSKTHQNKMESCII